MINEHHLEWALCHLKRFGGSDVFPPSHDYLAIQHNWDKIKKDLLDLISSGHMPSTPYFGMAPKTDTTFRAVHELSAFDNIIITAVLYSIAENIEKGRFPEESQSVFSYRLAPDHEGAFFKKGSDNWSHFATRRQELLEKYTSGYVLKTDISDFYNQIYIHRVQNAFEECLPIEQKSTAKFIHDFLMGLNSKISKGIPVGPSFSTIIAEVTLNDVDQRIASHGLEFVRWVDDIYMFHEDKTHLENSHHDISEYLYSTHRLIFNGSKTRLCPVPELQEFLEGNEDKVVDGLISKLQEEKYAELIDKLIEELDPYSHTEEDLEIIAEEMLDRYKQDESFAVISKAYYDLFKQAIDTRNTTLIKHVLKKCTVARIRSIAPLVQTHLDELFPTIREVAFYVKRVFTNEMQLECATTAANLCMKTNNRFSLRWLAYLLTLPEYPSDHTLPATVYASLELRDQLAIAAKHGDLHMIKPLRARVDQIPETDKHALIVALTVLTKDERNPILDCIEKKGRSMDVAYCRYAHNISGR